MTIETTEHILKIRSDFPQLKTQVRGKDLIYLDNGATTLKPQSMIDAITEHYSKEVSNIHRGVHYNSENGTRKFEETRIHLQKFLNAKEAFEIIFTKGTTESINLVAHSLKAFDLKRNQVILLSEMEHHSNIVPWQLIQEELGLKIKVIPVLDNGELDLLAYKNLITENDIALLSVTHVSNTLGTVNPIKEMIQSLKSVHPHALTLIDGAQAAAHHKIDVQDIDCDFYVLSAHKLFGPTSFGVLYGKESRLQKFPPYQGGGAMIDRVTFEKTTFHDLPNRLEAGTPAIAEGIAFKKSLEYIESLGFDFIEKREHALLKYAEEKLSEIPNLKIIGTAKNKSAVISFVIDGVHPQDLGTLLDQQGIAVRTGHHCTQPLMDRFKTKATTRASLTFYNTKEEIDFLVSAINKSLKLLL